MCTRISVFVPITADLDALEAWSEACGVALERVEGAAGQGRFRSILGTRSYCDCGTPIGARSRRGRGHDPERNARDLRRRGWSEAKIARALAQKAEAGQRREQRATAVAAARLEDWVTFLVGAPARARLRSIGISYREDGECLAPRDLEEGSRESASLASLEPDLLARLKEGVLLELSLAT
jgi:hypothetical protein